MRKKLAEDFHAKVGVVKEESVLPVACGFGLLLKRRQREVLSSADGFVVGSFFVEAVERGIEPKDLQKLAESIDPRKELLC